MLSQHTHTQTATDTHTHTHRHTHIHTLRAFSCSATLLVISINNILTCLSCSLPWVKEVCHGSGDEVKITVTNPICQTFLEIRQTGKELEMWSRQSESLWTRWKHVTFMCASFLAIIFFCLAEDPIFEKVLLLLSISF